MDKWQFLIDAQDKAASNPLRRERLNGLLAEWANFHRDDSDFLSEKLISEGFFTREQLDKLRRKAAKAEKETDEHYPWSKMPAGSMADLIRGEDLKQTVLTLADKHQWKIGDARREVGVRLLGAMYLWLRSKHRMFIRVRTNTSFLLRKVSMDREKDGRPPVDWREKPTAGSPLFDEPVMIWWEGRHMTFVSMGSEMMSFVHWTQTKTNANVSNWATLYTTPPSVDESMMIEMTKRSRSLYFVNEAERQAMIDKMGVDDVSEYGETVPYLTGSFNLLAAINSAPRFNVLKSNKATGKGRSALGGIRGVKVCELDMDELTKWADYYANLKPRKA